MCYGEETVNARSDLSEEKEVGNPTNIQITGFKTMDTV